MGERITSSVYDEFVEYFMKMVQIYSKDGLVLAYNHLYLTKGLIKSPVEIRNKVIEDICSMSYESIVEIFQFKRLSHIHHKKLVSIINNIIKNVNN